MIDVHRRRQAGERAVIASVHLPAFAQGGVVAAVCTVGGDCLSLSPLGMEEPYRGAVALLDELYAAVAESEGRAAVALSPDEVESCVERGVVALVPALEGAMPFEGEVDRVGEFHERGVRVVGLTWNSRNEFAVGLDSGEGGLSSAGKRAVERMNPPGRRGRPRPLGPPSGTWSGRRARPCTTRTRTRRRCTTIRATSTTSNSVRSGRAAAP